MKISRVLFCLPLLILLASCAKPINVAIDVETKELLPRELAFQYLKKGEKKHKSLMECQFHEDYLRGWDLWWFEGDYDEMSYEVLEFSQETFIHIYRITIFCRLDDFKDDNELENTVTALESMGVRPKKQLRKNG